ncbi:Na+/H+ antiporter, NhaC-like [Moorella glycerini]|uniref:Malate-2H(+)/Na(+)-lactate antiporter n=1 Tax=Neomoorella stamsii TaxID=1266720 RepID=A0A9X7J5W5_9FIRM|nr:MULTISPECIES: Na+/H+ antiporter NhaC family protein [Moorella]PRR77545.1 Malate-2H(+)/Na(+)-lactate antiporter [Moorella stamsii]CEP69408.1 Na+/H+ antiporter, NhaC-like [Moorella glycerini]
MKLNRISWTEALAALVPAILFLITASLLGLPLQLPFLFGIFLAGGVGRRCGYRWTEIEKAALKGMNQCSFALLILILIGATIGIWIAAGIIPTFIYYGLHLLSPRFFLAEACLLTFLMALATGSDAGAFGTIGVALLAIGHGLGVPVAITAGAITAGGIAGHIISPLSDLTALAVSTNGGNTPALIKLFTRRVITAQGISLFLYSLYGFFWIGNINMTATINLAASLEKLFVISPWLLTPIIILFCLIALRLPLVPVLGLNLLLSALVAIVVQGLKIDAIIQAMSAGYVPATRDEIAGMLARGGIISFGNVIELIFLASAWASILQHIGVLEFLLGKLTDLKLLKGRICATGTLLGVLMSVLTCAIIPAILVPSLWLKDRYIAAGYRAEHLSRDLVESSFAAAALVPWSNLNFIVLGTLGTGAFQTTPYNFFAWLIIIPGFVAGLRSKARTFKQKS